MDLILVRHAELCLAGRADDVRNTRAVATDVDQRQLAERLLAQAKEQGVELGGPNGLLNQLTKNVLETALDAEMTEHVGCEGHDPAGRAAAIRATALDLKRCSPRSAPVKIEVPPDTNSSFEPQIVKKGSAG